MIDPEIKAKYEALKAKAQAIEERVTVCEHSYGHDYKQQRVSRIVHRELTFHADDPPNFYHDDANCKCRSFVCARCGNRVSQESAENYISFQNIKE